MKLLIKVGISAAVIFAVAYLSQGELLAVNGVVPALIAAVVLGLVNALIKPIVKLVALPVTLLTLGLFSLAINGLMLWLATLVVPGLDTVGWWQTMVAALLISVGTSVLNWFVDRDD